MPRRSTPLSARVPGGDTGLHHEAVLAAEAEAGIALDGPVDQPTRSADASRVQRLREGVRSIRAGGGTVGDRVLFVLGGILVPLGLVAVIVGWYGAAHTPNVFEQVPYLISGGLFGLGLVFLGAFLYFAHWMTELVKEHRAQSTALVAAIHHLEEVVARAGTRSTSTAPVAETAAGIGDDVALVATDTGTMAHRPDCVVVAGKSGVRAVSATDGLAACKLCDPYGALTN